MLYKMDYFGNGDSYAHTYKFFKKKKNVILCLYDMFGCLDYMTWILATLF